MRLLKSLSLCGGCGWQGARRKQEPTEGTRRPVMVMAVYLETEAEELELEVEANRADRGWLDWIWRLGRRSHQG